MQEPHSALELNEQDYRIHEMEEEAENQFLTELDDKLNEN